MEIWKDIKNYEGRYQVSNLGRVKRLPNGRGYNSKEIIKSTNRLSADGYVIITLPNGERPLHRLVAETFILNPENKETVNHIDGVKTNNHLTNLEWATRTEQLNHSYKLGLRKSLKGENNPASKLTNKQVKWLRDNYSKETKSKTLYKLAKEFNVSDTTIYNVLNNITYK